MGANNQKEAIEEKISSSSVLNLSLGSIDSISDEPSSLNSKKINKLKPENDNLEWKEFSLEGKEEEIKLKYFTEDEKDLKDGIIHRKRSKSFISNKLIKEAPKPQLKKSDEYISPLKLNTKYFGNVPNWNKRPNSILYDFQKNLIDCKSCNDEDYQNEDDNFFISSNNETERTTPNPEDLQDLLSCRKKMSNFKNCINDRTIKEYENILNIENLFIYGKNNCNQHHKKNNFWHKHIKQQQLKYSNKMFSSNLLSSDDNIVKRSDTTFDNETTKDHGLFILGILESAANERKGRNTVNV